MLAFLICVPALCQQQQTCSADGTVVNSVTGEPIPRARIAVLPSRSGTVSDSVGHWSVSNIPCAPQRFAATRPGFLSGPVTTKDVPLHDLRIELIPQAVITGRVLDDAGDPVPNARISVLSSRVLEGKRSFQQSSGITTNDLGEYRIAFLPAGKVILCAAAPNNDLIDSTVLGESCYPGPVEGGASSALSLFAGRESRVDFNLARIPTVKVRGRLAGVPEGISAAITLVRPNSQSNTNGVGKDGSFEFHGVTSGSWTLSVDYWENGKRLLARQPLEVGGSDIDGVVVHVDAGVALTGTVSPAAKQIAAVLHGTDRLLGSGSAQWDKTHSSFTIPDIIPGSYMLIVNVRPPYYVKSAMLGGRDMSRDPVPLLQATGPVVVTLGDDAGSVQGQIQDANGDAVPGWVMLKRDPRPPIMAPAGADGRFKIGGVAPGDYTVYAWDDLQQVEYADPEWMRHNAGPGTPVTVTAGQTVDVKATRVVAPHE